MPTNDEELTAGPTIEPAPEREVPMTFGGFLAMAAADCVEGTDAGPTRRIPRSECTRYSPCQERRDQDWAISARLDDVTCGLHCDADGRWTLRVGGHLVTLVEFCCWCGGRLA